MVFLNVIAISNYFLSKLSQHYGTLYIGHSYVDAYG